MRSLRNLAITFALGLMVLLYPSPAAANQSASGWCEAGATIVVTSGLNSANQMQGSFPMCLVTVNLVGGGLATIYADNALTPLANPFVAQTGGQWQFYAPNGHYSVVNSGAGMPTPVTYPDIILNDPVQQSLTQCIVAFTATPTFTASSCSLFSMTLTGNVTSTVVTGAATGQLIAVTLTQGAGGPWTFAWPANFINPPLLTPTAAKSEQFEFVLEADGNWHSLGVGESQVFDTAINGNVLRINGVTVNGVTGSGAAVLATSPTISTPTINGATISTSTIASPTITGTVAGGAIYTAPTLTSPVETGTVSGNRTDSGVVNNTGNQYFDSGQPWIDAKGCGAVMDGTTDDTTALANCMTTAATNGYRLLINCGTILTGPLTVPATLKSLRGMGMPCTTIKFKRQAYANNALLLNVTSNTNNLSMGDFTIDVADTSFGSGTTGTYTIYVKTSTGPILDHISISGQGGYGVFLDGTTNVKVDTLYVNNTNGPYQVAGCYATNTSGTSRDNKCRNMHLTGVFNYGSQMGNGTDDVISDSEGEMTVSNAGGVWMWSLGTCLHCSIVNTYSRNSIHECINLTDSNYSDATKNHCEWTGGLAGTLGQDFGMSINGTANSARFNSMVGNVLLNSYKAAFGIADQSQYNLIADNQCKDCATRLEAASPGTGVELSAYTVTATLSNLNNMFKGNTFVNEAGAVTYGYQESNAGGAGSVVDQEIIENNTFRGTINTAKYSTSGTNSLVFDEDWANYTPVITPGSGAITSYTVTSASYKRRGKEIALQLDFTITNNGTGATSVNVSTPTGLPAKSNGGTVNCRDTVVSGKTSVGQMSGAGGTIFQYDGAYPGATNARFVCTAEYSL